MRKIDKGDMGVTIAISLLIFGILIVFFPFSILDGLTIGSFELEINKYSELGEFISGVTTPLISIAAFILLYLTYRSQAEELRQTRIVLDNQHKSFKLQQFETTYFQLISTFNSLINDFTVRRYRTTQIGKKNETIRWEERGKKCFESFKDFINAIQIKEIRETKKEEKLDLEFINIVFNKFISQNQTEIEPYFNLLTEMILFVTDSDTTNKEKYLSFLFAQLTFNELRLLTYYGLSNKGRKKVKLIIEEYSLLESIKDDDYIKEEIKRLYDQKAFG